MKKNIKQVFTSVFHGCRVLLKTETSKSNIKKQKDKKSNSRLHHNDPVFSYESDLISDKEIVFSLQ